jgi:hypothetical protein
MSLLRTAHVRVLAVWFFVGLLATVSLQSRLAETDLNDDFGCFIESSDNVDGDEILSRLVLTDDLLTPQAPRPHAVVRWFIPVEVVGDVFARALPGFTPRAPPLSPRFA